MNAMHPGIDPDAGTLPQRLPAGPGRPAGHRRGGHGVLHAVTSFEALRLNYGKVHDISMYFNIIVMQIGIQIVLIDLWANLALKKNGPY